MISTSRQRANRGKRQKRRISLTQAKLYYKKMSIKKTNSKEKKRRKRKLEIASNFLKMGPIMIIS